MIRASLSAILILLGLASTAAATDRAPSFILPGSIDKTIHDGVRDADGKADDLLSAGLNTAGLQDPAPPTFDDPLNPTPKELRRLAIYNNFRAITDMTTEGGFGLFWGPALAPDFGGDVEPGLIPGVEYKALIRTSGGSGNINNVPVAVQIPDHFDPADPCIFLASPSGSRGYYGGAAVGEWGLFEGCAVVLPGKGTGTGFHLLGSDQVYDRDGVLSAADDIDKNAQFAVRRTGKLDRFLDRHPDRVATKHAHSEINPERLWGEFALQGIVFAFWALNDHLNRDGYGDDLFLPDNTLVIASGTSNGAGTSLRALEADRSGLIDGLVVIEPNINPDSAGKFGIDFGGDLFFGHGTSLYDNHTLMAMYAPCAALHPSLAGTPFNLDPIGAAEGTRANRCEALNSFGLLTSEGQEAQAEEALQVLRDNGYYEEQDTLLASHEWLNLWRSLNPTYAAAHGRFEVADNLCDISFAATTAEGAPAPLPEAAAAQLFAVSGGIPPTGGVNLINDGAANGPISENLSISPTSGLADLNSDGARCFRYLATGNEFLLGGSAEPGDRQRLRRVQRGIEETLTTGDLGGTPAIILTGRSDALVFPNYHSRPYYGLNQVIEGENSQLSYIEVVNAQHFEAFISTLWLDPATGAVQFVPLHYYLFQALDWMRDYLKGAEPALPPSQVVRPLPRGLSPYSEADAGTALLPDIQEAPDAAERIVFSNGILSIPR